MNKEINGLLNRARKYRNEDKYHEIADLLDQAEAIRSKNDPLSKGRIYTFRAQIHRDRHNTKKALECYNNALSAFQKLSDKDRIAHTIRHVADLERELEQTDNSKKHYRESLEIYRTNTETNPLDLANALRGFALLLEKISLSEEARQSWMEARELYRKTGIQEGVEECDTHLTET